MTDATDKREQSLIAKYGGVEALAEQRRKWQAKSRKNPNTKGAGFKKISPERRKEISKLGHQARWGNRGTKAE